MERQYLTDLQVALLIGCGVQTLRNNRYKGVGLPYIKNGRSVRYKIQDVEDYLERRKIVPGS